MDDGRQKTSILKLGMRFSTDTKKFEFDESAEKEDLEKKRDGESDRQRMARVFYAYEPIICGLYSLYIDVEFKRNPLSLI